MPKRLDLQASPLTGLGLHPASRPSTQRLASHRGNLVSHPGRNASGTNPPSTSPGSILGSSLSITLIPFGDRSGSHGEKAPAVSKQQHRPLTSLTTSTSGPRLSLGGAGGGGGTGSDRGHLRCPLRVWKDTPKLSQHRDGTEALAPSWCSSRLSEDHTAPQVQTQVLSRALYVP